MQFETLPKQSRTEANQSAELRGILEQAARPRWQINATTSSRSLTRPNSSKGRRQPRSPACRSGSILNSTRTLRKTLWFCKQTRPLAQADIMNTSQRNWNVTKLQRKAYSNIALWKLKVQTEWRSKRAYRRGLLKLLFNASFLILFANMVILTFSPLV